MIEPLSLVQVCQPKVLHPCVVCFLDSLNNHVEDHLPLRFHEVPVRRHGQAPRGALRATVHVALHAGGPEHVAAKQNPQESQRLQGPHPPSVAVLVRGEVGRQPRQVQHGGEAVSVAEEDCFQLPRLLAQDLLMKCLCGAMDGPSKVIPDRAKQTVIALVLGVVERVVGRCVHHILQRTILHPARNALKVAVPDAVHDVKPHKVYRDAFVGEEAKPSRHQKRK
mmetsp:Transcript_34244/g.55088  ORF Transcript_34244/g.55088 Transcript_34244/m.55088 type:complete len:223 (-) Transcript_34244:711-1379(-)